MALSDDAKAELKDAIRIVREDRFEGFLRKRFAPEKKDPLLNEDPPQDPTKDPVKDPAKPPVQPPPAKDPAQDPPPPAKAKSRYWGELMDD